MCGNPQGTFLRSGPASIHYLISEGSPKNTEGLPVSVTQPHKGMSRCVTDTCKPQKGIPEDERQELACKLGCISTLCPYPALSSLLSFI